LKKEFESLNKDISDLLKKNPNIAKPRVIAVSKRQPIERIRELYRLGQRDFAENYLSEALEKQTQLQDLNIRWHFIGNIQSKKIKEMVGKFNLIHSVSRLKEAESLAIAAQKNNVVQDILIQVNIASEESKQGFSPEESNRAALQIKDLIGLRLIGIMVFPPLSHTQAESHHWFEQGRLLFEQIKGVIGPQFERLSMGTSGDYLLALSHGATDIRVGERLLGPRA